MDNALAFPANGPGSILGPASAGVDFVCHSLE